MGCSKRGGRQELLDGYTALGQLVNRIDEYLREAYPDFFGSSPQHPLLPVKPYKVIHDNLWGTNQFTWRELALIDSPIIQRLRRIHQVGLVHKVYPSAHHTRFEHSLGVLILASRIFESLSVTNRSTLANIHEAINREQELPEFLSQLKQELRLAALLHDCGHSLYSHTSERVYRDLDTLRKASAELSDIVGKEKGAGEVLSFCIALTNSVRSLLERVKGRLQSTPPEEQPASIDMQSVALMIVGRARNPYLQFLGDIISSGLDADKLDYLLRDAAGAGLPIRYDLERYLYAVRIQSEPLADGHEQLEALYQSVNSKTDRKPADASHPHPYYDAYRLRLKRAGLNSFEQIVICKMMLYGYLYHHPKVRAAEGMLERLLRHSVSLWKNEGEGDAEVVCRFLDYTDSALESDAFAHSKDDVTRDYSYRIVNRLLPREVYRFCGNSAAYAEGALLKDYLLNLQNKATGPATKARLEQEIGKQLIKLKPEIGDSPEKALKRAGIWVDVPKVPDFEDVNTPLAEDPATSVQFSHVFPVEPWTQAYTSHKYFVRIFAFSEYFEEALKAGRAAMEREIRIEGDDFYKSIMRNRRP